jgi:hypothetical protein
MLKMKPKPNIIEIKDLKYFCGIGIYVSVEIAVDICDSSLIHSTHHVRHVVDSMDSNLPVLKSLLSIKNQNN